MSDEQHQMASGTQRLALRWLSGCAAGCALTLAAELAWGQVRCSGEPAVEVAIELHPPEPGVHARLRQQLEAELAARHIAVCPKGPGVALLGRVRVRAIPELSLAEVTIETSTRGELVRIMEMGSLPREARPSAIASATDELLAGWLASPSEPEARPSDPARGQERGLRQRPPSAVPLALPRALGLGGAVTRFRDFATAYGAEVRARLWPAPGWLLTFSFGGSTASYGLPPHPAEGALVQNVSDRPVATPNGVSYVEWHAGIDAGYELWSPSHALEVAAVMGLSLHRSTLQLAYASDSDNWRLGFPDAFPTGFASNGSGDSISGWDGLGRVGLEGSWKRGPVHLSASVIGLLPLSSTYSDDLELADGTYTARRGLGAHWGMELGLGAWYAFE